MGFNLTIDPGMGLHFESVYISRSATEFLQTTDLSRTDLLRGL